MTINGDIIAHEIDENCVCGPTVIPIVNEHGGISWLVVHHSLDGREKNE